MGIEQKINYQLNKYPGVKKVIKRVYQRTMYTISPKIKSEGNIVRISPDDNSHEYFFGYYDKSPWDASDRYMLCLRANNTWSDVSPKEKADILLIDTDLPESDKNRVRKIAETSSWNVQQACMAQWLGPDFSSRILFNDYRDGKYVAVIKELETGKERVIPAPVYTVSADGKTALTLDFSRLYNLRPGYGYYNVPEKTKGIALPDATAVWKIDLTNGDVQPLLTYKDFAAFQPRPEMQEAGSVHKVNHLMLSPSGSRCMVLYRWFVGQRKYTRLVTFNVDGTDMYVLSDDDMVSHCFWKDDEHIIAFENKKDGGPGYYLMRDKTQDYFHCWPELNGDGHPSYSPNGKLIVTDAYPDRTRVASIRVMDGTDEKKDVTTVVAKVFAPFKYDNDTRCDLHPRWNRKGDTICFDSVFEGHRGLYTVGLSGIMLPEREENEPFIMNNSPKYSVITPVFNSFHLMNRYFSSLSNQTYKDFEVIIIDDCSTDGSFEKIKEYSDVSPLTIRAFRTKTNGGPGVARNIGIEEARGEWITFIDNDDWVDNQLFEKIDNIITNNNNVGSVVFDYYTSNGKVHSEAKSMYSANSGIVSPEDCVANVRNHTFGKVYCLAKCKEKGVMFPPLRRCEDVAFVIRAILACQSCYYYSEPLYYYLQRANSLSNNSNFDESDMLYAFSILEKELGKKYQKALKEKSVTDILYGVLLMMCKSGKSRKEIIKYINAYEKKYPEWEKTDIIKNLGKSKKVFLLLAKHRNVTGLKAISKAHSFLIGRT
jgi:glycosyltransferase involved in cell wall biosynthesis